MDENILLYDIQSGDTLDKIGVAIGMTGEQLKDFHNAHCSRMERLWFNNLTGVKQILIPKEYKSPEILRTEKEKELPPASITRDFYADSYKIEELFSGISERDLKLEYNVDVAFRKMHDNNLPYEAVDVRSYNFTKNGVFPDDKMSSIAIACMESISPVSFAVSFFGGISDFFEFDHLKKKFNHKKQDIEDFYSGTIYREYLNKFSDTLEKRDYALKLFSSTLLYQVLFPKMEWFYKTDSWTEKFYFLPNSILLKCAMRATYNHDDTAMVETELKGEIKDMFSLQEILRGISFDTENEELADGEITLLYKTDKKTKKLLEAKASVIFRKENTMYKEQTLKLTQNG